MKNTIKRNGGQAIAETIITVSVLGMLLFASIALFQLLNADINANKAARLAAWHGVLNSGFDEVQVRRNINQTILRRSGGDSEFIGRTSTGRENIYDPTSNIEFDVQGISPTYAFPSNRSSFIGNLAGLNQNTISKVSLSIPLGDLVVVKSTDQAPRSRGFCPVDEGYDSCSGRLVETPPPYDPIADAYRLNVRGTAALLSNGFIPPNEASFKNAIENVASDGTPMTFFEVFRGPLSFLGFEEADAAMGPDGLSTVAEEQSRILPSGLGTFE